MFFYNYRTRCKYFREPLHIGGNLNFHFIRLCSEFVNDENYPLLILIQIDERDRKRTRYHNGKLFN